MALSFVCQWGIWDYPAELFIMFLNEVPKEEKDNGWFMLALFMLCLVIFHVHTIFCCLGKFIKSIAGWAYAKLLAFDWIFSIITSWVRFSWLGPFLLWANFRLGQHHVMSSWTDRTWRWISIFLVKMSLTFCSDGLSFRVWSTYSSPKAALRNQF